MFLILCILCIEFYKVLETICLKSLRAGSNCRLSASASWSSGREPVQWTGGQGFESFTGGFPCLFSARFSFVFMFNIVLLSSVWHCLNWRSVIHYICNYMLKKDNIRFFHSCYPFQIPLNLINKLHFAPSPCIFYEKYARNNFVLKCANCHQPRRVNLIECYN